MPNSDNDGFGMDAVRCGSYFHGLMKAARDTKELKFAAAMTQLQEIVEQMENGELPLENLIERYEEGMRLVKICSDKLGVAEQKIEILTKKSTMPATDSPVSAPDSAGADALG